MNLLIFIVIFGTLLSVGFFLLPYLLRGGGKLKVSQMPVTTLETMDEAVITTDVNLQIGYFNYAALNLFQYQHNELSKLNLSKLFLPQNFQILQEKLLLPLNASEVSRLSEILILDSTNHNIPVTASASKISREQQISGFIFVFKDIREIKSYVNMVEDKAAIIQSKNEELNILQAALREEKESVERKVVERTQELRQEQTRLQASINSLIQGFVLTDADQNVIATNARAKELLQMPESGGSPIKLTNLIINIDPKISDLIFQAITKNETVQKGDINFGSKVLRVFISPFREDPSATQIAGLVLLIQDETEQKIIERSKDEFFTIASHELRTPLTIIKGYAWMLRKHFDPKTDPDVENIINTIDSSSVHLIDIVNQFIDATTIQQGKLYLNIKTIDLNAVIAEQVKIHLSLAENKKLFLTFNPSPGPLMINADQGRVVQILGNLLDNAVKFTEKGGITVTTNIDGDFGKVEVADTGSGISEKNKPLLFRKFQQAGDSLLARQEGTGLGLYIAKSLTEQMQGQIALEKSEEKKGSTFSVKLPLAQQTGTG